MRIQMTDKYYLIDTTTLDLRGVFCETNSKQQPQQKGTAMAKIVKKNELQLLNGFLHHDGVIVSPRFVYQYVQLDAMLQRAIYDKERAQEQSTTKHFELESEFGGRLIEVPTPKTPHMDKAEKNADKTAREIRLIGKWEIINCWLDEYRDVAQFVISKNVVLHENDYDVVCLDTPVLGNPLELTENRLVQILCKALDYPLEQCL